ncbi:uncharacterized protein KY384_000855 [Bacidia gigantensis]|uniref:uncharacterized protein n=1 Tax=Bacidia gigantensis TaxID=2732470 RepID=UPI001D04CD43|nr:uncharacterized protein KY384_000855 [Bacidia gigantensis]KAG8534013.1 hypothetical protein KY384_000855 [Bacidia gigantensis]
MPARQLAPTKKRIELPITRDKRDNKPSRRMRVKKIMFVKHAMRPDIRERDDHLRAVREDTRKAKRAWPQRSIKARSCTDWDEPSQAKPATERCLGSNSDQADLLSQLLVRLSAFLAYLEAFMSATLHLFLFPTRNGDSIIPLRAINGQDDSDDFGCDDPEAVKLMIDFLYLHNYEPDTPPSAVNQSNNPLPGKNSDEVFGGGSTLENDGFAEDTAREEEKRVEDSVVDANQMDGGKDPTDNCAAAAFSPVDGPLGGGVLTIQSKMYVLGSKYHIPSLQTTSLSKFDAAAKQDWETDDLATAISIAFGNTPESDTLLRNLLIQVILKHLHKLVGNQAFANAINQVEGLLMELLREKTLLHYYKIACSICGGSKARICAVLCHMPKAMVKAFIVADIQILLFTVTCLQYS